MVAVNVVDGVKYGFRLLGYLLAVTIVGFVLIAIGGAFAPGPFDSGNPILALIFVLAGVAIIYAGGLGLLYKVIADGVEMGMLSAGRGGGAGNMLGGTGGSGGTQRPPAGQQYQGNPGQQYQSQQHQGGQQRAQGGQQARGQGDGRGGNQGRNEGGNQPPADWEPGN